MPRNPAFAEWLIDLATANPPPGREEWAGAMRAEFEASETHHTGWALGCLGAAIGWRLRSDWLYLLVFVAVVAFSGQIMWTPFFWAAKAHLIPHDLVGPLFQYGRFLIPAGVCMGFAGVRPRYWAPVGLVLPLVFVTQGVLQAAHDFHTSVFDVHPFNATLEVGVAALVGYCLVAAMIGRAIGSMLTTRLPRRA